MDQEVGLGCSRANSEGRRSEREREDPKILGGSKRRVWKPVFRQREGRSKDLGHEKGV